MKHAWNRSRTFRGDSGGAFDAAPVGELDQGLILRLGLQCGDVSADVDRIQYVLNIARVITAARERKEAA